MRKTFIALALVTVVAIVAGPATAGGRGGNGGNGGGKGGGGKPSSGGTGTLSLVVVSSPYNDGLSHYNGTVTFDVSSTAYRPSVMLDCYQGGTHVYAASAGFFPEYFWTKDFILRSNAWTGGAADCTAKLYTTQDGIRLTILATLSFSAAA